MKTQKILIFFALIFSLQTIAPAQKIYTSSERQEYIKKQFKKVNDEITDCMGRQPECKLNNDIVIANYTTLINGAPELSEIVARRGFFYKMFLKRYDLAAKDYSTAIEIEPLLSYFLYRAECYVELGKNDLAIFDYSQAIEINTKDSQNYSADKVQNLELWRFARAELYFKTGNYERAVADYTSVIESNSGTNDAAWIAHSYYGRMLAYEKLKRKDLAKNDKKKWKELRGY